jgi:hypothetical protein
MDDKLFEQELKQFDFSSCHPVREQLLNKLHTMQKLRSNRWQSAKLSDEELDWVAAAGGRNEEKNPFNPKE